MLAPQNPPIYTFNAVDIRRRSDFEVQNLGNVRSGDLAFKSSDNGDT